MMINGVQSSALSGTLQSNANASASTPAQRLQFVQRMMQQMMNMMQDLIKTMQDYRSGARSNVIMVGQAANLKDKDIADIAAWYASQASDLKDLRDFK